MARTPGQRAGLTRGAILAAARAALADEGVDGLSMRRLAARLGVAPNALYSHVAGKTALLDELLDDVLAEVDVPDAGVRGREGVRRLMTSTFDVLLTHGELVPLYLARQGARGPQAQALGEVMLELLADSGVDRQAGLDARRVLIVYTIGFAAFATQPATGPDADAQRPVGSSEVRVNFVHGLDWLLAGIVGQR